MKRSIIILISVVVVAIVAVCWFDFSGFRPNEPMVQGKPLSYWFTDEGATNNYGSRPPINFLSMGYDYNHQMAVRETGTNAIPTLLRLMRARDSSFKLKLMALARKQHWVEIKFTAATNLSSRAGEVRCWQVIGPAGSNAIPALLQIIRDPNPARAANAANALGGIHTNAAMCVPALIEALRSTNEQLVLAATWSLRNFRAEAKPAVRALVKIADAPDPYMSMQAKNTLDAIDPQAYDQAYIVPP